MADLSNFAVSKTYLKPKDVAEPFVTKIDMVEIETSKFGTKPVLSFGEHKLTMSTFNVARLGKAWGMNDDEWVGKEIEVSTEMITINKDDVLVITTNPVSDAVAGADQDNPFNKVDADGPPTANMNPDALD